MQKQKEKNNGKIYAILILIVIVVVALFTFFIYLFTKYDKTEYEVTVGSVLYDENQEYIKTEGEAYLTQKFDRKYYLYEKINGKTKRYNLGKNAVLYKEGDMYIYLYGTAYQVLSSGDVDTLSGETKIVKTSPTKFFKLDDRKYLIVDGQIRSENVLDTKEYSIITLDKKGNPSFSNHLIDFKTIKEVIVKTSNFEFDVANEKLIYQDTEIDLKNVIGSSNEYEPPEEEVIDYTDEKLEALQNNIKDNADTIVGYYDQYFNDVVNSVNNLTTSVIGVNDNAIASVTKEDVYYDFDKWLVLKSVISGVSSIDVEYSVFDPQNEYESIYLIVDGKDTIKEDGTIDTNEDNHHLSRNESKYTIRNLKPNSMYTIKLAYKKLNDPEPTTEDAIVAETKKAEYKLTVKKITVVTNLINSQIQKTTTLNYELTVDPFFKFSKAKIHAILDDGETKITYPDDLNQKPEILASNIDSSGILKGQIVLPPTHKPTKNNTLVIDEFEICVDEEMKSCEPLDLEVEYKFFNFN